MTTQTSRQHHTHRIGDRAAAIRAAYRTHGAPPRGHRYGAEGTWADGETIVEALLLDGGAGKPGGRTATLELRAEMTGKAKVLQHDELWWLVEEALDRMAETSDGWPKGLTIRVDGLREAHAE